MSKTNGEASASPKLLRLIDANLNRLREGIRVVEDIQRYIYENKNLTKELKELRHLARIENYKVYLKHRDIIGDISKETTNSEASRENLESIILANIKRAQESARVLEESLKLVSTKDAERFKDIRYRLYDIEKRVL